MNWLQSNCIPPLEGLEPSQLIEMEEGGVRSGSEKGGVMNVGTHFSNPSFQRVHSRNAGRREEAAFAAKFCSSSFSIPSEGNQSFMTFAKVFDFLDPPPHLSLSHSRSIPCTIICSCSTPSPLKCRCHKWNPPNLSIHCLLSPLPPSLPPSLRFPFQQLI